MRERAQSPAGAAAAGLWRVKSVNAASAPNSRGKIAGKLLLNIKCLFFST